MYWSEQLTERWMFDYYDHDQLVLNERMYEYMLQLAESSQIAFRCMQSCWALFSLIE